MGRVRIVFEQSVCRADEPGEPLASARVEVACVDQATFFVLCAIPDFLVEKLSL